MRILRNNLIVFFISAVALTGCAHVKEAGKGILGISTNEIEKDRPNAVKKIFSCEYKKAYDLTLTALANMGSYVYAKKDDLIAFYVSEEDTTVVGVFLKAVDPLSTEIEVSSPSVYAKELIASKLFRRIDLLLSLKEDLKKEEIDKLMSASDQVPSQADKQPEVIKEEVAPGSQAVVNEETKIEEPIKAPDAAIQEQPKIQEPVQQNQ